MCVVITGGNSTLPYYNLWEGKIRVTICGSVPSSQVQCQSLEYAPGSAANSVGCWTASDHNRRLMVNAMCHACTPENLDLIARLFDNTVLRGRWGHTKKSNTKELTQALMRKCPATWLAALRHYFYSDRLDKT